MESTRFFLPRDWRVPPNINIKTDLFAFGSVIYYIMTGRGPYDELSDDEVAAKFERKEFPNVKEMTCGRAISGCWTENFSSADGIFKAIMG